MSSAPEFKPSPLTDAERKELLSRPYSGGEVFTHEPAAQHPAGEREAHFGDPCVKCGAPHDDVPVGPCGGLSTALEKVRAQMKWERDGHASISLSHLRAILSTIKGDD